MEKEWNQLPKDEESTGHTDDQCYAVYYAWTERGLESKRKKYFQRYDPRGYSTRVAYCRKQSEGWWKMRITRWHSCD